MKNILMLFLILSNLCFASHFKYYKEATIENCVYKLNELSKNYKIKSYKIVPSRTGGRYIADIYYYNMIIEVENK